jgi:hypothetical protein
MVHAYTVGTYPDSLLAVEAVITVSSALDASLRITDGLINEQTIQHSQPTLEANLLLLVPSIQKVVGSNLVSNTGYP